MSVLDWINFGKVSAERDDLLSHYFFDNGVLKSICDSPTSFLILGRKGAGKTAIFRHLTENPRKFLGSNDLLVSLSFEDYNWNIHALLKNENKSESLLYKQSWRFVILIESLKAVSGWFVNSGKPPPKQIITATKLLERLFDSPVPSIYQIVGRKLLSLSGFTLPKAGLDLDGGSLDSISVDGGEISFDQVQRNPSLQQHLAENIENLIDSLDKALSSTRDQWPTTFVCFDRVDEAWDEVSYDASRKVIAGLVAASDSINAQYRGRLRPIVFLREDIFDSLSLNDANKLREDCGALLHWTKDSIASLLLKRVNYFAEKHGQVAITSLDALFDKTEMRQGARPSRYILLRTMMRPRDLISFLNRTVDAMKDKKNGLFVDETQEFERLECDSVYDAEPGYSEWLKLEVLEEWKVQRPSIVSLLNALQNHGSTNFSLENLVAELKKLSIPEAPAETLESLRFLFENSVIGFRLGSSNEWRFKCFYPSQGFVESEEYRVHHGLVRALNLTETRKAS
ncbi:P-loop ATPase, Sll1717 family [Achromobacter xylosoxidans]|uniref:P-loop ATPase, Sll1717 family n=1 Tax=Alcaligenes xylosoxydans xylosoxydans TaxID=85698 RepID=UPI001F13B9A0|nr:hypothetical protein [Achromobacter xylosoxidans]